MVAILIAAAVGTLLPVVGVGITIVDWATKAAIALLFFLYGVRLSPAEAFAGLRHWRLHVVILAFTYLAFPVIGLLIGLVADHILSPSLYLGVLFLCLVPSTVQSSITFTSIAKGNIAGAIVSASASNLLGVIITPLLALLLIRGHGAIPIDPGSIIDIGVQLLLPFVLGQLARKWLAEPVARNRSWLKYVDQFVVVLVVYGAFAAGMREHMWTQVAWRDVVLLIALCGALVALMLWATWAVAGAAGFNRADRIAIQFCGTKKSLATGAPMASVLFAGQAVGLIVLPLMIFHQIQLMACTVLSAHYARSAPDDAEAV